MTKVTDIDWKHDPVSLRNPMKELYTYGKKKDSNTIQQKSTGLYF